MNDTVKKSILICSVITSLVLASCNNTSNKFSDMNNHQHSHSDSIYTCPMHAEIIGKKGEKCAKCGMDLKLVESNANNIEVKITATPKIIEANQPTLFSLSITDNEKPTDLEVAHEKKIHLILVNEDLTWFHHIHPEEQANGKYTVTETFPNGGKYIMFADFKANGASPTLNKQELEVTGNKVIQADTVTNKWVSNVDGYKVTLVKGNDFKTNRPQHFGISVEQDGKQLLSKELELYLSAVAHVVMISKEGKEFKHIHSVANEKFPIYGETSFDKPGVYRMWVQFKTKGKVHTADFTINVAQGDEQISDDRPQKHHH